MKILLLNPHRSDFIFESVAYTKIGRKSLKKYGYLSKYFEEKDTTFLCLNSSLYYHLKKFNLQFLDKFFLNIELNLFKKSNKIKHEIITGTDNLNKYDLVFCFGFSIRDLSSKHIKYLSLNSNKFIIHLSHYHVFSKKLSEWSEISNIIFCADSDIRNNFMFTYFVQKPIPFFILSFTINQRFKKINNFENRENKVISTGTFHEFEKYLTIREIKQNPISGIFGFLTLHTERRIISKFKDKLPNLVSLNSSMETVQIFNLIKKSNKVNQTTYFAQDIVSLYNEYKFVFVGEDIPGLPGIGIFEAVACGCIPIINRSCYIGTPFEKQDISIDYHNINELLSIFNNLKNFKYINHVNLEKLREDVINFYSDDYQINLFNIFLKN
jgi:hypothetical protein